MKIADFRLLVLLLLIGILILVAAPVWATGDCKGQSCNDGGDIVIGGDTINVGGDTIGGTELTTGDVGVSSKDRAYAFAHGMGDVDINQCMGSTQWSTILVSKQKLVVNLWCMAESYDARGLYRMAALMRCEIDIVSKHFDDHAACIEANTIVPQPLPEPVMVEDEDEELHLEQQMQYQTLKEELDELRLAVNKPRTVQKTIEKPLLTPEQRQALMEVVK